MSRKNSASRFRRSEKRALNANPLSFAPNSVAPVNTSRVVKTLVPMNGVQNNYLQSMQNNVITFAIGSAGTGKTYMAAAYAAELLTSGAIENLIITRPNIEAGRSLGFLPGTIEEKYAPYLEGVLEVLYERLGRSQTDYMVKRGIIKFKPLGFLRGVTFKNSFIILDEAQNCEVSEMKLFLTRIGEDCKVIIDGDIRQCDLKHGMSGLQDAVQRLYGIKKIGLIEFRNSDCIRSPMCKAILEAYQS